MTEKLDCNIIQTDCEKLLKTDFSEKIDLTFLDPPFNQDKDYQSHDDKMPETEYWDWMRRVCDLIYQKTVDGGAIYFMQREKNTRFVLQINVPACDILCFLLKYLFFNVNDFL